MRLRAADQLWKDLSLHSATQQMVFLVLQTCGDSTQRDICPVPQSSSNSTAGQLAVNPKITPRLPPPPPPMQQNSTPPVVSACSGYVTKEQIVAGLEYAAGQEYLPFDPWSAAAALRAFLPCMHA